MGWKYIIVMKMIIACKIFVYEPEVRIRFKISRPRNEHNNKINAKSNKVKIVQWI
jgi:hypothetical protein